MGVKLFFGLNSKADNKKVISLCQSCPVKKECLDYVMQNESHHLRMGIWGGLRPYERFELHDR